jgi:hypothetical protein
MDEIYKDHSHCLTSPEIRGERDAPISCYCRDAVAQARYVYFMYLLSGADRNLNGPFLVLERNVHQVCGWEDAAVAEATESKSWQWNGPEVFRVFPTEEVIESIHPEEKDGRSVGRWVPFTVRLVFHDAKGGITKIENFSTREFQSILSKETIH